MRAKPCTWISWAADGRPSCEHGAAISSGPNWECPVKAYERVRRYRTTEKGKACRKRENASDHARSSKRLYELTRVGQTRLT